MNGFFLSRFFNDYFFEERSAHDTKIFAIYITQRIIEKGEVLFQGHRAAQLNRKDPETQKYFLISAHCELSRCSHS